MPGPRPSRAASRPPQGEEKGQALPFSRRIFSVRAMRHGTKKNLPEKEGRRSAGRRMQWSAPHRRMLPPDSASGADARHGRSACANPPLAGALASRRSAAALVAGRTLATRSRPRFARRKCEGVTFAFASRLSQAPGSPVVMPAGTMPGPPGSGLRDRPREPRSLQLQDRIRKAPFEERAAALLYGARKLSRNLFQAQERLDPTALFDPPRTFSRQRAGEFDALKNHQSPAAWESVARIIAAICWPPKRNVGCRFAHPRRAC